MEVGDLVWVRFAVYNPDSFGDFGLKWKLGYIIKDDEYQAGLYKVYVMEYQKEQKIFINDIMPLEKHTTIYEKPEQPNNENVES